LLPWGDEPKGVGGLKVFAGVVPISHPLWQFLLLASPEGVQ
jgi:hypothetical protein